MSGGDARIGGEAVRRQSAMESQRAARGAGFGQQLVTCGPATRLVFLTLALALGTWGCGSSSDAQNRTPAGPSGTQAASSSSHAGRQPDAAADGGAGPAGILTVLSVEREVDILAQRDGILVHALKDEGQEVRAGEELARLDDRQVQAELEKAQADLKVSEDNVLYNEAEWKAKEANYRRYQQLRELGLSSEADLENAEFLAKGAEYDLQAWHATVESNKASIRQLEAQLDQTRIRAPFSGVVARRYVREGQSVVKDDKCFRISQLSPLEVQFEVPEASLRKPSMGDSIHLTLAGQSARELTARIIKLSPTVDPASDSYDVTARLMGSNLAGLRPGMAVRVDWPGATASMP